MIIRNIASLSAMALLLAGCGTLAAPRYSSSADTIVALRDEVTQGLTVGAFTSSEAAQKKQVCRGVGYVVPPDSKPYAEYIRDALIAELKMAEKYNQAGPITLTGHLDKVDMNSSAGRWAFSLTVQSSTGETVEVSETYQFETSFGGDVACNQTAQALMPAVQDLILKLVKSPGFQKMVRSSATTS
jgi:hypothetical protein